MRHLVLLLALLMAHTAFGEMDVFQCRRKHCKKKKYHTGLLHPKGEAELGKFGKTHVVLNDCGNMPATFDLSDVGVDLPIYDQGQCGSCWAFSKTSSLESAMIANGKPYQRLSEQELVSCDRQNIGCNGGSLNTTEYQVSHGQGLDANFPYSAKDMRCKKIPVAAKGTDFVHVGDNMTAPSTVQVQCALYKSHTIPWITVAASQDWMNFPNQPHQPVTSCPRGQTNHAIGITGWETIAGKVYFKIRNSWNTTWGYQGTALLALGCYNLGEQVAYIMTQAMPCTPPVVKLPVWVGIHPGDEIELAVKKMDGIKYSWSANGIPTMDTGSQISVSPTADTVYNVMAKNECGSAQSSTQVKIVTSK